MMCFEAMRLSQLLIDVPIRRKMIYSFGACNRTMVFQNILGYIYGKAASPLMILVFDS